MELVTEPSKVTDFIEGKIYQTSKSSILSRDNSQFFTLASRKHDSLFIFTFTFQAERPSMLDEPMFDPRFMMQFARLYVDNYMLNYTGYCGVDSLNSHHIKVEVQTYRNMYATTPCSFF